MMNNLDLGQTDENWYFISLMDTMLLWHLLTEVHIAAKFPHPSSSCRAGVGKTHAFEASVLPLNYSQR